MQKKWPGLLVALALLLGGCSRREESVPVWETATPSPEPTAAATPGIDPVRVYMDELTLREMVGQLFFIRPDALIPGKTQSQVDGPDPDAVVAVTQELRQTLTAYPVGGFALFEKNIQTPEQLTALVAGLNESCRVPPLLGVDEEGGSVARLGRNKAFSLPRYESAAAVAASGDPRDAESMGRTIGAYLRRYGIQVDLAPVADVNTNPQNPVIGERAFSSDPLTVARMAAAFAAGLKEEGILPVYKHFPGHGDTREDSHNGPAVSVKTMSELEACEWLPYTWGDLSGCAVMVGHISLPSVTGEDTPASLSEPIVTGLLREHLGFQGLVITDALSMGAVTARCTPGQAAVLALQAGCDMLLLPADFTDSFEAVLSAVEDGTISYERLEQSVYRVLSAKYSLGLLS